MPIPKPSSGESQRDFIKRCYLQIKDEYDRPTSFAICYSKWKDRK